jgi:hypothetical protein
VSPSAGMIRMKMVARIRFSTGWRPVSNSQILDSLNYFLLISVLCAAVITLVTILSQACVRKIQKCLMKEPELPMRPVRRTE